MKIAKPFADMQVSRPARIATVAPCHGGDRKETDPEIPIIRLTPA